MRSWSSCSGRRDAFVRDQQARQPGAEAPAPGAAVGLVAEAVVEHRAGQSVAEQCARREAHHELGILARRGGATRGVRQLAAALVDERDDRRQTAAPGVERRFACQRAPSEQPRVARVAERLEHALEHVEDRLLACRRAQRLHHLGFEAGRHVGGERRHQAFAASEVMEDRRVGDTEVARDVLEADCLGAPLAQPLLGGFEDETARLRGAATGPGGH